MGGDRPDPPLASNVVPAAEAGPEAPPEPAPPLAKPAPSRESGLPVDAGGASSKAFSDGSIVVRVVDPDGTPVAGFPLQLWRGGPFPDEGREAQGVEVPPTDSNGESRVAASTAPRDAEIAPAALFVRTPGVAISRDSAGAQSHQVSIDPDSLAEALSSLQQK